MERQTLVSYSDIQSLPDLTCYVTLPGPYPAVKLSEISDTTEGRSGVYSA